MPYRSSKPLPPVEFLRECFRVDGTDLIWRRRPRHHFRNQRAYHTVLHRDPGRVAGNRDNCVAIAPYGTFSCRRIIEALQTETTSPEGEAAKRPSDENKWRSPHQDKAGSPRARKNSGVTP